MSSQCSSPMDFQSLETIRRRQQELEVSLEYRKERLRRLVQGGSSNEDGKKGDLQRFSGRKDFQQLRGQAGRRKELQNELQRSSKSVVNSSKEISQGEREEIQEKVDENSTAIRFAEGVHQGEQTVDGLNSEEAAKTTQRSKNSICNTSESSEYDTVKNHEILHQNMGVQNTFAKWKRSLGAKNSFENFPVRSAALEKFFQEFQTEENLNLVPRQVLPGLKSSSSKESYIPGREALGSKESYIPFKKETSSSLNSSQRGFSPSGDVEWRRKAPKMNAERLFKDTRAIKQYFQAVTFDHLDENIFSSEKVEDEMRELLIFSLFNESQEIQELVSQNRNQAILKELLGNRNQGQDQDQNQELDQNLDENLDQNNLNVVKSEENEIEGDEEPLLLQGSQTGDTSSAHGSAHTAHTGLYSATATSKKTEDSKTEGAAVSDNNTTVSGDPSSNPSEVQVLGNLYEKFFYQSLRIKEEEQKNSVLKDQSEASDPRKSKEEVGQEEKASKDFPSEVEKGGKDLLRNQQDEDLDGKKVQDAVVHGRGHGREEVRVQIQEPLEETRAVEFTVDQRSTGGATEEQEKAEAVDIAPLQLPSFKNNRIGFSSDLNSNPSLNPNRYSNSTHTTLESNQQEDFFNFLPKITQEVIVPSEKVGPDLQQSVFDSIQKLIQNTFSPVSGGRLSGYQSSQSLGGLDQVEDGLGGVGLSSKESLGSAKSKESQISFRNGAESSHFAKVGGSEISSSPMLCGLFDVSQGPKSKSKESIPDPGVSEKKRRFGGGETSPESAPEGKEESSPEIQEYTSSTDSPAWGIKIPPNRINPVFGNRENPDWMREQRKSSFPAHENRPEETREESDFFEIIGGDGPKENRPVVPSSEEEKEDQIQEDKIGPGDLIGFQEDNIPQDLDWIPARLDNIPPTNNGVFPKLQNLRDYGLTPDDENSFPEERRLNFAGENQIVSSEIPEEQLEMIDPPPEEQERLLKPMSIAAKKLKIVEKKGSSEIRPSQKKVLPQKSKKEIEAEKETVREMLLQVEQGKDQGNHSNRYFHAKEEDSTNVKEEEGLGSSQKASLLEKSPSFLENLHNFRKIFLPSKTCIINDQEIQILHSDDLSGVDLVGREESKKNEHEESSEHEGSKKNSVGNPTTNAFVGETGNLTSKKSPIRISGPFFSHSSLRKEVRKGNVGNVGSHRAENSFPDSPLLSPPCKAQISRSQNPFQVTNCGNQWRVSPKQVGNSSTGATGSAVPTVPTLRNPMAVPVPTSPILSSNYGLDVQLQKSCLRSDFGLSPSLSSSRSRSPLRSRGQFGVKKSTLSPPKSLHFRQIPEMILGDKRLSPFVPSRGNKNNQNQGSDNTRIIISSNSKTTGQNLLGVPSHLLLERRSPQKPKTSSNSLKQGVSLRTSRSFSPQSRLVPKSPIQKKNISFQDHSSPKYSQLLQDIPQQYLRTSTSQLPTMGTERMCFQRQNAHQQTLSPTNFSQFSPTNFPYYLNRSPTNFSPSLTKKPQQKRVKNFQQQPQNKFSQNLKNFSQPQNTAISAASVYPSLYSRGGTSGNAQKIQTPAGEKHFCLGSLPVGSPLMPSPLIPPPNSSNSNWNYQDIDVLLKGKDLVLPPNLKNFSQNGRNKSPSPNISPCNMVPPNNASLTMEEKLQQNRFLFENIQNLKSSISNSVQNFDFLKEDFRTSVSALSRGLPLGMNTNGTNGTHVNVDTNVNAQEFRIFTDQSEIESQPGQSEQDSFHSDFYSKKSQGSHTQSQPLQKSFEPANIRELLAEIKALERKKRQMVSHC